MKEIITNQRILPILNHPIINYWLLVWVQKIEPNHIIAQNAAHVITCDQTGHHKKIRQISST